MANISSRSAVEYILTLSEAEAQGLFQLMADGTNFQTLDGLEIRSVFEKFNDILDYRRRVKFSSIAKVEK